jgi:hypothetical protein
LDTPPNHALFSMMHSVKVTRKNSQSDGFIQPQQLLHPSPSPSPLHSTPSPISHNYSDYNSDVQSRSRSLSLTSDYSLFSHISDLPKKNVPNMKDFLEGLDKEFGNGKFTCYLSVFEEQEIRVSHLTKLSDSEYNLMGITIIGRRQTLRDEARKYQ